MATRESQTLQMIVLSFGIIIVVLGGLSIWLNSNWRTERARADGLDEEMQGVRKNASDHITENQNLKTMMGFSAEEDAASLEKTFQSDRANYGKGLDEAQLTYQGMLEKLQIRSDEADGEAAATNKQLKELKAAMLALENQKNAQIKQHEDEAESAKDDLAKERKEFQDARDKFNTTIEELTAERDKAREEMDTTVTAKDAEIADTKGKLGIVQRQLERAQEIITETKPEATFDVPDGQIAWVNQRSRTVWINLGHADALRSQVSFAVYNPGQVIRNDVKPKAKIEVTRVLKSHLAEASIVADDLKDPILPEDPIFSTAWSRGSRIHFALSGVLDLDGDDKSDTDRVRDIIMINGGVVDEYIAADGKRVKNGDGMTLDTKFLVVGKPPAPADKIYNATNTVNKDAKTLGIKRINLENFLDLMGWESGERTVPLGTSARGSDFRARLPGGVQRLDAGGAQLPESSFKRRYPGTPY